MAVFPKRPPRKGADPDDVGAVFVLSRELPKGFLVGAVVGAAVFVAGFAKLKAILHARTSSPVRG
jgi:hypothetical protein